MADEFVVLEEDTWVERKLPGSKDRTTRVLLGRAGTRVHKSKLPRGHMAVDGDVEAAERRVEQAAGESEPEADDSREMWARFAASATGEPVEVFADMDVAAIRAELVERGVVEAPDATGDENGPGSPEAPGGDDTTGDAVSDEQGATADAAGADPALPEPPGRNESTDTWRDYALAVEQARAGEDGPSDERTDAIMGASRDDLIAAYDPDPTPAASDDD